MKLVRSITLTALSALVVCTSVSAVAETNAPSPMMNRLYGQMPMNNHLMMQRMMQMRQQNMPMAAGSADSAAAPGNMSMGNMPMMGNQAGADSKGQPSMGMMSGNNGGMPMMQMMQQRQAMMQAHMTSIENHLANIENLLKQLVEQQTK